MQKGKDHQQLSAPPENSPQEERGTRRREAGIVQCECCGALIPGYRFKVPVEGDDSPSCMVCGYSNRFLRDL